MARLFGENDCHLIAHTHKYAAPSLSFDEYKSTPADSYVWDKEGFHKEAIAAGADTSSNQFEQWSHVRRCSCCSCCCSCCCS